jgi:hypothetical protein
MVVAFEFIIRVLALDVNKLLLTKMFADSMVNKLELTNDVELALTLNILLEHVKLLFAEISTSFDEIFAESADAILK